MGAERNVRHPFKLCKPDLKEQTKATAKDFAERLFLALGELEASASALLAVLLALFATRVAGHEAFCLERLAELRVEDHEGAGDAELDGVGLAHDAATFYGGDDVEGLADVGDAEGPLGGCALLCGDEVDVKLFFVDGEFAAAGTQEDACDRGLATAGSVVLDQICHGAP